MRKAPLRRPVEVCEVGWTALLPASDYSTAVTGDMLYIDGRFYVEGMMLH